MKSNGKTFFVFLLGLLLLQFSYAQDHDQDGVEIVEVSKKEIIYEDQEEIDSLIMLLMNSEDGPEKVKNYIQLSDLYLNRNYSEALKYAQEGLALSSSIQDMEGMLDCQMKIAFIYLSYMVDLEKAIIAYEDALEIAMELDDKWSQIAIYRGMSVLYSSLKNFNAACDYMEHALILAEELGDQNEISTINAHLGGIHEDEGDTLTAIMYYEKVLKIEEDGSFENTSNASLVAVAHLYFLKNDLREAIKYYRISLKRFQRSQDYRWQSYTHSQLAQLYFSEKNYDKAESHAINGLTLAEDFNLTKEMTDNYLILVNIADSLGKHDLSERYRQAYDTLMAKISKDEKLLNSKVDLVELVEDTTSESSHQAEKKSAISRFIEAGIISLCVVLLILFMIMPSRKK